MIRSSLYLAAGFLFAVPTFFVSAHPINPSGSEHGQKRDGSIAMTMGARRWYQPDSHPAHLLFRRQATTDTTSGAANSTQPAVGSDAWTALYPAGLPVVSKMPQAWKDALAAISGSLPNIPLSNKGVYPGGLNAGGSQICSSTDQCRNNDTDIWDAPDGMLGVSFDDGPTEFSDRLYDFLASQGQRATHFMIGQNMLGLPDAVQKAFHGGDTIACHTWSHRYMTGLSNEEVVMEFGYTMQIIADLTGGRIPRFWRPPYGDSDNRVRYIAKNIFGLVQVDWNQDTDDWKLGEDPKVTTTSIAAHLKKWIEGPKSPGLIILEHELSAGAVQCFIDAYPNMKAQGWDIRDIPDLFNLPYYANSANDNSTVYSLAPEKAGQTSIDLSGATSTSSSPAANATGTREDKTSLALPLAMSPTTVMTLSVALTMISFLI